MTRLNQMGKQAEHTFRAEQDATELRMLQIATFVANDPHTQQLFLQGKHAVESEGGGGGGVRASQIRQLLYEHVRQSRDVLAQQFNFRQLHFHLAPGSLSFLRAHKPEKFGDRMDSVRFTIVTANSTLRPTTGFETGRVVSGIRGVTPVFAIDSKTNEKIHVGALEAGTSFTTSLTLFHKNQPWLNAAVLLHKKHLQANIWPEFLDRMLLERPFINGFRVEGTTSPQIDKFLTRNDFAKTSAPSEPHILRDKELHYNFISFALRDFRGKTDPQQADAGRIIIWQDVSSEFAAHHHNIRNLIIYGFLLFAVIEILLFYGLQLMTQRLQKELERTRKLEAVSDKATQVISHIDQSIDQPQLQLQQVIQEQVDDAVKAVDAGFGLFISSTKKRNEYRILAVSDMVWSTMSGKKLSEQARNTMQQQGYFPIKLTGNLLIKVLQSTQPVILTNNDCKGFVSSILPPGHPTINNLLLVPMTAGKYGSGLLILANRKNGFGMDEQITAKAYAAAAALIMHADLREVARLAAEESSRLKTEFLGNISHELRTPMNTIMGIGQILAESQLDDRQQRFIKNINLSSITMSNLIDDILMVTKLDDLSKEELTIKVFSPTQLLNRVSDNFAIEAKERGVKINTEFSDQLPIGVNGYPAQVEQILNLLMGNAIKFSHDGEVTLALTVLKMDDDVTTLKISVSDQGIGIGEQQQQLIFQPFYQVDGAKTRQYEGSGLGLTIAKKICKQLDGELTVESAIGQGSRFTIQLKLQSVVPTAEDLSASVTGDDNTAFKVETASVLPLGSLSEIAQLLHLLEDPLTKLQPKPCQEIAQTLTNKQWPDHMAEEIEKLTSLISKYRFVEAREAVSRIKEML
ncbi:MAG: hypothetical protein BA874_06650 [Desulfuromonadales bacterium C00003068]|nr:MAG: hypothetical protein BA874_06650 [Desulfuromonadales bacterium C00003068]